jgi:hypothetical protein
MHVVPELTVHRLVPEVRLIDTITTLAHVYGLNSWIERLKLCTPGVLITDAVSQCEGISGTNQAYFVGRRMLGVVIRGAQALGIGLQVFVSAVQIGGEEIGLIDPAYLRVVFRVQRFSSYFRGIIVEDPTQ